MIGVSSIGGDGEEGEGVGEQSRLDRAFAPFGHALSFRSSQLVAGCEAGMSELHMMTLAPMAK